jgi:hypothetical protein
MNNQEHLVHARALRAAILAAANTWLPRRDILLEWLEKFQNRVAATNYELGHTEAADLAALDRFLRRKAVLVA